MTFFLAVKSLSGSFHVVSLLLISSSRAIFPCSTFFSATIAATGLLIEPAWKRVSVLTGSLVSMSLTP